MIWRGILAATLMFTQTLYANEEISPEVMDLIQNSVFVGNEAYSRKKFNEITKATPAHLQFYAFEAGTDTCRTALKRLVAMGKAESKNVCEEEEGYVTVSRLKGLENLDFTAGRTLKKEMESINQLGQALVGVMYALPSDFTTWDKSEPLTVQGWGKNKISAPELDDDAWYINFIGHPIAGGVYTASAKHAGATNLEAFGFSVFMSTVYWEYGNEAVIETPSIQDLVITPTVGFFFGLGMYNLNKKIESNDGKWMGSDFMGKLGMLITDPSGQFQKGMDKLSEGRIQVLRIGFRVIELPEDLVFGSPNHHEQQLGFGVDFGF